MPSITSARPTGKRTAVKKVACMEGKSLVELAEAIRVLGTGTQEDQRELEQWVESMKKHLDEATLQKILAERKQAQENNAGGPVVAELRKAVHKVSSETLQLLGNAHVEL